MLYRLDDRSNLPELIRRIGCDPGGVKIMSAKGRHHLFLIKDLKTPAANILKQDALAIGAELAVPSGVITCDVEKVDALLICNETQLQILAKKEKAQPFGLKKVAGELERFIHLPSHKPQLMGILNINEDSFFSQSRTRAEEIVARAERMILDGADMIDVGGVSSRPGSDPVTPEEEMARVAPAIDALHAAGIHDRAVLSLDSYEPTVLTYALQRGFSIVNDITGLTDDRVCDVAAKYDATVCIMHMQGDPKSMQRAPEYGDVVAEVDAFFEERIAKAKAFGIDKLILDIGVGFGKTLEHNVALIRHQSTFLRHGYPLLIGGSRKSMIDAISKAPVDARLPGTLALHLKALETGASIVRAHDVPEHAQAMRVYSALNS